MSESGPSDEKVQQRLHGDADTDCQSEETKKVACSLVPARYVLAALGAWGFTVMFSLRGSLGVALVAMVNFTSSLQTDAEGGINGSVTENGDSEQGEFDWDETTQGVILGAYYYSYPFFQVAGGFLAERSGGRNVLGLSVLCSAVMTLMIPLAARAGVAYFILIRVLQGVAESLTFPSMNAMWGLWAPSQEKSRLTNFTYAGVEIGTVIGMMTAGVLCQSGIAGGWPFVFYINGAMGCLWVLFWMALAHDSPARHPRITASERRYIESSVTSKEKLKTPWLHIFTSPAVWALGLNHLTVNWGFSTMIASLPTFMANILDFNIAANGLVSSLPFIAQFLGEITGGILADMIRTRGWLTTQNTRRLLNTFGAVSAAIFYVTTGYVEKTPMLAVALLTIGIGCSAFCTCCVRVGHIDIAPRFSGTLYGLTNGVSSVTGFLGPMVVGILTENQQTVGQWRIFFYLTGGLYLLTALVFFIFFKGEELWWAKAPSTAPPPATYDLLRDNPAESNAVA